ncbi:MAG: cellulase family glycosylhydrolase [Pirellulaceae bacterium]
MKASYRCAILLLLPVHLMAAEKPLALHPRNPHYFLFRSQPAILITSAEHYGAVLNADFDYVKYLDELARHGLNHTRLFSGAYCEDEKAFNIARNTLAPAAGKFLAPWARSDVPGYANGGNKFDLAKWDEKYFARLKDFLSQAGKRGIVVEMNLFCPFYEDSMWRLSPQNPANNVQKAGPQDRLKVYTLDKHGGLLDFHDALVKKIAAELNEFDNLYYEVCNEPYFGGVTMAWQHHIVDTIVAVEKELPQRHLISLNVANGTAKIEKPHPEVSIFNFHYASPPQAVGENYALGKVIGDNETGFKGTGDTPYRREAWEFLLAGGGLYNNLDYSFVVGHEDGTFQYPDKQPGGGNRGFREQMHILKDFMYSFDLVRMKPDTTTVKKISSDKVGVTVLSEPGKQYAIYAFGGGPLKVTLALPPGGYDVEWVDVMTGKSLGKKDVGPNEDGIVELLSPEFTADVAAKVRARGSKP